MADTFTEKLVAQVIKNLQITIRSIHVRYEDKFTNRHRPFAAGVTLEGLDFKVLMPNCTFIVLWISDESHQKLVPALALPFPSSFLLWIRNIVRSLLLLQVTIG